MIVDVTHSINHNFREANISYFDHNVGLKVRYVIQSLNIYRILLAQTKKKHTNVTSPFRNKMIKEILFLENSLNGD